MHLAAVADSNIVLSGIQTLGESLAASPRWRRYCEGLDGLDRAFAAILLENELKYLKQLPEAVKTLQIGNFDRMAA